MATRRVRAGARYIYDPVMLDVVHPPYNLEPGDVVTVVNLHGCPKANTMGHCHVNKADGTFGGLVCTNSLKPLKDMSPARAAHRAQVRSNALAKYAATIQTLKPRRES